MNNQKLNLPAESSRQTKEKRRLHTGGNTAGSGRICLVFNGPKPFTAHLLKYKIIGDRPNLPICLPESLV
jgi:hypothetical protein